MTTKTSSTEEGYQSPFLLTNEQIAQLGIEEHRAELYRRKHYQDSFGIETWYDELRSETFTTKVLPLTFEEGTALYHAFELNFKFKEKAQFTEFDKQVLTKLEGRIDEALKQSFAQHGAFIKLNTRSPKDTPWREHTDPQYTKLVDDEITKYAPSERTPNNVSIAFLKAMSKAMRVTSGADAIKLLIKSHRINEDLGKNIQFGEKFFTSKLILREWIPEVADTPQGEFRCFVHDKKLNAVTQYFCDTKFFTTEAQKEEIKKKIKNYFEETVLKSKLLHPSFVIDFFVGKNKMYIIELNPFHIGAGAGLFSWKEDRNLFMNGPLEFRFLETEPGTEIYTNSLTIQWEKYLVKKFGVAIPGHEELLEEYNEKKETGLGGYMLWTIIAGGVASASALYYYLTK